MAYLVSFFMVALVLGLVAVASNPSPYFAAFGLVLAAGAGCCVIGSSGSSFLSLVLFLVYLGGMLVVFAYSAALTAEPYPEAWGSLSVLGYVLVYLFFIVVGYYLVGGLSFSGVLWEGGAVVRVDAVGVSVLYSLGGTMLILGGWVLLLSLFVVLEIVRGHYRGALRAV